MRAPVHHRFPSGDVVYGVLCTFLLFLMAAMDNTTQPSALTSSKTAQLRYLYRSVADGFFYSEKPTPQQVQTFTELVSSKDADPSVLAELYIQWQNHKRYRTRAPDELELPIERALYAGLVKYTQAQTAYHRAH